PLRWRDKGDGSAQEAVMDIAYRVLRNADDEIFGVFVEGHRVETDVDASTLLSNREREVLSLAAAGKTASETAIILSISKRTCETHIYSAARKLDTSNTTQTVVQAILRGELHLDAPLP